MYLQWPNGYIGEYKATIAGKLLGANRKQKVTEVSRDTFLASKGKATEVKAAKGKPEKPVEPTAKE